MYEFRGATLQEAVHQALRYPALSTKKLAKVAAKFDFTARVRMGSALFVGEGNLSFALTMSRKPRVPTSSILATVHEAEEDLTDSGYDNARKLLKLGCSVITGVVVISTVDSPFYEGAFKMDEAARKAGFAAPAIYTFDSEDYPGYTH